MARILVHFDEKFVSMLNKLEQGQLFSDEESVAFRKYKLLYSGDVKYAELVALGESLVTK